MGKKLLIFIIVLAGIALSGIVYVQFAYMKNAYVQNETLFDYKVNDALQSLVNNLDQMAMVEKIQVEMKKSKLKPKKKVQKQYTYNLPIDSIFEIRINDTLLNHINIPDFSSNSNMNWTFDEEKVLVYTDISKNNENRISVSSSPKMRFSGSHKNIFVFNGDTTFFRDGKEFQNKIKYKQDSNMVFSFKRELVKRKEKDIQKVVQKMVTESDKKLVHEIKKLNYSLIDSLLKSSLQNQQIDLSYEYKVIPDKESDKKVPSTKGFESDSKYKKYNAMLFPNDIVPKTDRIVVYFPERKNHLIKSLSILLPSSLFFSLIIIIAFTISIMMVLRQKKISDIKTDFINNMTHEFKTPIATISLAADTIVNQKVIGDKDKINQFIRIIKDENKRMNTQVERILQMAQLERKDLDLNLEMLDVHQLIGKVLENMDVQIKQMNGQVNTNFNAIDSDVFADEIHLTNVFNNLLDNALKYNAKTPEIKIYTSQLENGISVSFEDNGIGMSKEAQSKIFEKFYRVGKGNIHNVKGFGLGLSYVKAIVEGHGGRINVKSELDRGSRFDIYIPQKINGNGKSV